MLKSKTILEVKKEDRIYSFECEPTASLGEVYDALCSMRQYIVDRMVTQNEQQQGAQQAPEAETTAEKE